MRHARHARYGLIYERHVKSRGGNIRGNKPPMRPLYPAELYTWHTGGITIHAAYLVLP